MVFSNWMAGSLFKDRLFKTALAGFLLFGAVSLASAKYNIVKDGGFEIPKPKDTWEEKIDPNVITNKPIVDSHAPGGYESDHCGLTHTFNGTIYGYSYAELKQKEENGFSSRKITEIDSTEWYYKYTQHSSGIANFGVGFTSDQDTLYYTLYYIHGFYGAPKETPYLKVIHLTELGEEDVWNHEARKLGGENGDWVNEGLPLDAIINAVWVYSKGYSGDMGWRGQTVKWDYVKAMSTRYDHDFYVSSIFMPDSVEIGKSYRPGAEVQNLGAFDENSDVICNILYDGDSVVYSDTANVFLEVDSTRSVLFRNWMPEQEGSYLLNVYTALEEEQNPENDSLSKQINAYTGIEERAGEPIRSLVAFPNPTRGLLELKGGPEGQGFELYDTSGRLIDRVELKDGRLDLSGYSPGVYFLKGSGPEVEKVVIME